jgi:hypothetical protein
MFVVEDGLWKKIKGLREGQGRALELEAAAASSVTRWRATLLPATFTFDSFTCLPIVSPTLQHCHSQVEARQQATPESHSYTQYVRG